MLSPAEPNALTVTSVKLTSICVSDINVCYLLLVILFKGVVTNAEVLHLKRLAYHLVCRVRREFVGVAIVSFTSLQLECIQKV